jgi:hypothetical protein
MGLPCSIHVFPTLVKFWQSLAFLSNSLELANIILFPEVLLQSLFCLQYPPQLSRVHHSDLVNISYRVLEFSLPLPTFVHSFPERHRLLSNVITTEISKITKFYFKLRNTCLKLPFSKFALVIDGSTPIYNFNFQYFCVVLCIVSFVSFCILFVCKCVL